MKTILLSTLAIAGMATALSARAELPCTGGCNSSPSRADEFTYEDGKRYYDHGTVPGFDQLKGDWKLVASVKLDGFPDNSRSNGYDLSGLKNSDGSPDVELSFLQMDAFDGSVQDAVILKNLSSKEVHQGPNRITLNASEAGFSLWSYSQGAVTRDIHEEFGCRLIQDMPDRMVCALTLCLNLAAITYNPNLRFYDGKVVFYFGYVKE